MLTSLNKKNRTFYQRQQAFVLMAHSPSLKWGFWPTEKTH